ncbi:MAG: VOC family protein [Oscillospiraceae bacterium]
MKIHHIAVMTDDIFRLKNFYETYFDAKAGDLYHNPKTGILSYFLTFEGGSQIELIYKPHENVKRACCECPGYLHLAFTPGNRAGVDALTKRLADDGYEVVSQPRVTGDGYYESVVLDCDGNRIEITR